MTMMTIKMMTIMTIVFQVLHWLEASREEMGRVQGSEVLRETLGGIPMMEGNHCHYFDNDHGDRDDKSKYNE